MSSKILFQFYYSAIKIKTQSGQTLRRTYAFQFYYSAIKIYNTTLIYAHIPEFQFYYSAIKIADWLHGNRLYTAVSILL